MTPVKRYVEAKVVSGSMRAEIEVHEEGPGNEPVALVHLLCKPQTDITHENLIAFTAEVSQVVAEERDGEESHGAP